MPEIQIFYGHLNRVHYTVFLTEVFFKQPDIENALLSLFCIKFPGLPFTKEVKIFFFRNQLTRL